MADWIVSKFPKHHCYVEVFGGGGSVLMNKPRSNVEVYNDKDKDVVQFFQVLRDKPYELIRWVKQRPYHRDLHRKYAKQYFDGYRPDNDVERAGRFFYLRHSQFAAKYNSFSGFSVSKEQPQGSNKNLRKAAEDLAQFSERMQDITIDNRDWREILDRYDSEKTLFYCDPPYVEEGDALYSNDGFDHVGFAERLNSIDGCFVLSYTDLPPGLSNFNVLLKERKNRMRNGQPDKKRDTRTERLVLNFDPDECNMMRQANQNGLEAYQ